MVYRPRYLDPKRVKPVQVFLGKSGEKLEVLCSDGSILVFTARGICGFDAQGKLINSPITRRDIDERLLRSGVNTESKVQRGRCL